MNEFSKSEYKEEDLLLRQSLVALKDLIEEGRELEFEVNGLSCFLSRHETSRRYSLWIGSSEQAFPSLEELFHSARIGETAFSECWPRARIITLF